jgi:hypothetical protein
VSMASGARLAAALVCGICAGAIAGQNNRRLALGLLVVQYAAVTLLSAQFIALNIVAVKLAGGLIACSILGVTLARLPQTTNGRESGIIPAGRSFRLISVLLVAVAGWGLSRDRWMGILTLESSASLGSALLMTLGLLQLGTNDSPFRVGLGILTVLSGFEIAYASVEPSLAVLALLAMVHIGIALTVSYLILVVGRVSPNKQPMI